MGKSESAKMKGEEYLKGRKAGVEGTHGASRKGVAEKTLLPHSDVHDSGSETDLCDTAGRLYKDAVSGRGDKLGDKALTER